MTGTPEARRILIVDDTPANIRVLGEMLADYERIIATDGEQALRRALTPPLPDLILLDVMMPKLDGFEVCRRLKADARARDIPIIFVTAKGEVADETEGFALGAVDYITKPFSPPIVQSRVRTHLALKAAKDSLAEMNATLEVKVAERTRQLRLALERVKLGSLDTIVRLSRAAEFKDDSTGAHVLRMSHYAEAIARQLGLSKLESENILHAAPMHDVGKIGIPDHILLKPGQLDADEWKIMRRHCMMGARILAGSEVAVIRLAEVVALTHHEWWDGTGYPRRLEGTDIPLAGRITSMADVFDALTSARPYKEAFDNDLAFEIVRDRRGKHFDPDVVDAFFEAETEILRIKSLFSDDKVTSLTPLTYAARASRES